MPGGRHHLGRVVGGLLRRVDAAHRQVRHPLAERQVEVGRRVGGREVHRVPEPRQGHGQPRGDGGLADPALAHREDDAVPVRGELGDEALERRRQRVELRSAAAAGAAVLPNRCRVVQRPQRRRRR